MWSNDRKRPEIFLEGKAGSAPDLPVEDALCLPFHSIMRAVGQTREEKLCS